MLTSGYYSRKSRNVRFGGAIEAGNSARRYSAASLPAENCNSASLA